MTPLLRRLSLLMLTLEKFSVGVGDRFAHQAKAQLRACMLAEEAGAIVAPVWNKSNREHSFIGSEPSSVLEAAQEAVESLDWMRGWHVDADHIRIETVDRFLPYSDFFTIDVADAIGQPASAESVDAFIARHPELVGEVLSVVESLAREHMTLIMVTHEMRFARAVSDKVVFMHQGRVWESGTPEAIFDHPETVELRRFIH